MPELKQCEFILLRYLPDALTEEFVNIGVLLVEAGPDGGGFAGVRFTRDWRRARCLDPGLDLELLSQMESDLRRQLARADRRMVLSKMQDYCSNGIQLAAPKACLTADPAAELEALARMYLEHRRPGPRERSARQRIFRQMRAAFEQAGVWELMHKKIAAAEYTHKGDPLKIDCGYRPNGVLRMFHALPLAPEVDSAKALAFSFPELRAGMASKRNLKAELTAIVEPDLDREDEAISFALAMLARSDIAVAGAAELPRFAEMARQELRI